MSAAPSREGGLVLLGVDLLAARDGELLRNPFDFRLTLRAVRRVQRGRGVRRAS